MSDARRRRGRPKGTGINDWERLLTIASVMEKNPKLKVTTAIRELGFSDPSVIRRLRDKFKANRHVLLRSPAFRAPLNTSGSDQPERGNEPSRSSPTNEDRPINEPAVPAEELLRGRNPLPMETSAHHVDGQEQDVLQDCALLDTCSATMMSNMQSRVMNYLIAHPATFIALHQQAVISELISANIAKGREKNGHVY